MKLAQLDSATQNEWESLHHFRMRTYYVVEDGYNFADNNATEVTTMRNLKKFYRKNRITFIIFKESVTTYYADVLSSIWASASTEEKEILSELFIVGKTDRDTVHTDAEQDINMDNINASKSNDKHDRAMLHESSTITLTSAGYSDVSGMSYTTKDLGGNGTYIINASLTRYHTLSGKMTYFAIKVGADIISEQKQSTPADKRHIISLSGVALNVAPGTIIKIVSKTALAESKIIFRTLTLDGILDDRIIK